MLKKKVGIPACVGPVIHDVAERLRRQRRRRHPRRERGRGHPDQCLGEVVKDANELVIGTYMPVTTLVPWKTTSDGDGYILRQIYHTLVEMDEQSNFVPSLATEWQCSEDGLTWTVKIRDDVYWQTGNGLFDEKSKSRQKTSNSRMTTIWTRQTALCAIQNFPSL